MIKQGKGSGEAPTTGGQREGGTSPRPADLVRSSVSEGQLSFSLFGWALWGCLALSQRHQRMNQPDQGPNGDHPSGMIPHWESSARATQ